MGIRVRTIYFLSKNKKNITFFYLKMIVFSDVKICSILHRYVIIMVHTSPCLPIIKACFTLIVQPFGRAFLSWVTERRGLETDLRQFHIESHLT